jgi:hypothetical protein
LALGRLSADDDFTDQKIGPIAERKRKHVGRRRRAEKLSVKSGNRGIIHKGQADGSTLTPFAEQNRADNPPKHRASGPQQRLPVGDFEFE